MYSFVHDVKRTCSTNSTICRSEGNSSAAACKNANWIYQRMFIFGCCSAGYFLCRVDRCPVLGAGVVNFRHVPPLTNSGAEGTLWAYSAVGLVPCLAVKFTSTSVAQDLRILGRAKEYRIDVRFCDHASWWWRYHCLAGPPLLQILRRHCVGGRRHRRRCTKV